LLLVIAEEVYQKVVTPATELEPHIWAPEMFASSLPRPLLAPNPPQSQMAGRMSQITQLALQVAGARGRLLFALPSTVSPPPASAMRSGHRQLGGSFVKS